MLSASDTAAKIGVDARTFRKFLRSNFSPFKPVGQGARYSFDEKDFEELQEKFKAWSGGKKTPSEAVPSKANKRAQKADPIAGDDLMTRIGSSIAERQRAHGLICEFKQPHVRVKGLDVACRQPVAKDSKFCKSHKQMRWCGGLDQQHGCGTKRPLCKFHDSDMTDDEMQAIVDSVEESRTELTPLGVLAGE